MIHLDTNLIIGAIDASDLHHPAARRVLSGPGPFAASAVAGGFPREREKFLRMVP